MILNEKDIEPKTRAALKSTLGKSVIDSISITPDKAAELINDDTLVVLVDVHRPKMTMAPIICEKARSIAVIDHHRKAEDAVDNPVFNYIDTSSSSASEMVTEIIHYNKNEVDIDPKYATIMLAGILLDTNHFRRMTTTRTFEAAVYLKDMGADNDLADSFLKDEYEEFLLKTKILNNAETPYFSVVTTYAPQDEIVDRTLLAKVGEESLNIKGIRAIFVLGQIAEDVVGISARSDGYLNVQMIMEKMGGGGHLTSAATQLPNKTVDEAREELAKILELYINDAKAS